jgi:hypothetical protein
VKRLYRDCAYAPMFDLLPFLEAHGFTNYIVSGGGWDFIRHVAPPTLGVFQYAVVLRHHRQGSLKGGSRPAPKLRLDQDVALRESAPPSRAAAKYRGSNSPQRGKSGEKTTQRELHVRIKGQ